MVEEEKGRNTMEALRDTSIKKQETRCKGRELENNLKIDKNEVDCRKGN